MPFELRLHIIITLASPTQITMRSDAMGDGPARFRQSRWASLALAMVLIGLMTLQLRFLSTQVRHQGNLICIMYPPCGILLISNYMYTVQSGRIQL